MIPSRTITRWSAAVLFALAGCEEAAPVASVSPAPQAVVQTTEIVPAGPGQIELTDPKVTLEPPNLVRFQVQYKFTQGGPSKHYRCEISFPGTANQGVKQMESWELKPEGIIRDGIVLQTPPVEKFEIRVWEADSPQDGFHLISNVASGKVE
jgi:hypothetical protein